MIDLYRNKNNLILHFFLIPKAPCGFKILIVISNKPCFHPIWPITNYLI